MVLLYVGRVSHAISLVSARLSSSNTETAIHSLNPQPAAALGGCHMYRYHCALSQLAPCRRFRLREKPVRFLLRRSAASAYRIYKCILVRRSKAASTIPSHVQLCSCSCLAVARAHRCRMPTFVGPRTKARLSPTSRTSAAASHRQRARLPTSTLGHGVPGNDQEIRYVFY